MPLTGVINYVFAFIDEITMTTMYNTVIISAK